MSLVSLVRKVSTTKGVLSVLGKAGVLAGAAALMIVLLISKSGSAVHLKSATSVWAIFVKGYHLVWTTITKEPILVFILIIVFIILVEIIQEDVDLTIR